METMSERLPEPFGGVDESVFGPLPPEALDFWHLYKEVLEDWQREWGLKTVTFPTRRELMNVLQRHTHTDPDTGITKSDYITRALQEKDMKS